VIFDSDRVTITLELAGASKSVSDEPVESPAQSNTFPLAVPDNCMYSLPMASDVGVDGHASTAEAVWEAVELPARRS